MTDLTAIVTRWHHDALGHMTTEPDGEYVAYTDYARVLEEAARHKGEIGLAIRERDVYRQRAITAEADLASVREVLREMRPYVATCVFYRDHPDLKKIDAALFSTLGGRMEDVKRYSNVFAVVVSCTPLNMDAPTRIMVQFPEPTTLIPATDYDAVVQRCEALRITLSRIEGHLADVGTVNTEAEVGVLQLAQRCAQAEARAIRLAAAVREMLKRTEYLPSTGRGGEGASWIR